MRKEVNCPNCGAPLNQAGQCEYCGTYCEDTTSNKNIKGFVITGIKDMRMYNTETGELIWRTKL